MSWRRTSTVCVSCCRITAVCALHISTRLTPSTSASRCVCRGRDDNHELSAISMQARHRNMRNPSQFLGCRGMLAIYCVQPITQATSAQAEQSQAQFRPQALDSYCVHRPRQQGLRFRSLAATARRPRLSALAPCLPITCGRSRGSSAL
jgi:hypothetical protein